MNFAKSLLASAMLLASSSPVVAAEAFPYVGVLFGYDHIEVSDPYGSGSEDGVAYGGVAGVDFKAIPGSLLGAEVEVSGASTSQSTYFSTGEVVKVSAGRDLYVGLRAGYVVMPHVLLYAKGGFTNARVNASYTDASGTYHAGTDLNGYRIGAGVEKSFRKLRVRTEYRFSDYGDYNFFGLFSTGIVTKRHQVLLGALVDF